MALLTGFHSFQIDEGLENVTRIDLEDFNQ